MISPHAGYGFSGVLTAAALRAGAAWPPARIAILSPAHRHAFAGLAVPSQAGYGFPGFEIAIDGPARDRLVAAGLVQVTDQAHDFEHGIETQLPFLNALYPGVPVLPVVIGQTETAPVAALVDALAAAPGETLFVLSSDLSHFLSRDRALVRDAGTARKIETGDHAALGGQDACGARGIAGYLASRHGAGARVLRLGMSSSFATTGDAARVVGYGAWSLHGPADDILGATERARLLQVARERLELRACNGQAGELPLKGFGPRLLGHGASFVTLERDGRLRGCIGTLSAHQPLVRDVAENAVKAGFSDPRFPPVAVAELAALRLKISVLGRPAPVEAADEAAALAALVPGQSGAILSDGRRRGLFLPQVWDSLPEPRAFLRGLRRKAGVAEDHWSGTTRLELFRAEAFGEA
ncbi:MAG: AmmeMemoRadiSam system protein A [Paracoccaceae bacterium]